jgi:hypothetical protein
VALTGPLPGLVRVSADGAAGARRRLSGRVLPALISIETHGQVAVVQMTHGKANALGHDRVPELATQLARLERSGPGYLQEFLPALSEAFPALFNCSVPVVAAVNGHAVVGGCILTVPAATGVLNTGHGRIGGHRTAGRAPVSSHRAGDLAVRRGHPPAAGTHPLRPDVSGR